MGKEAALTRLQPDDEQTEPQHYWLKHYRASEVSGKSMAEYARDTGLQLQRSITGRKGWCSLAPLNPSHFLTLRSFTKSRSNGNNVLMLHAGFVSPMA